ncbi:MAG: hypothetical protein ABR610_00780 [Thermoanaerobaculia bacterium]
MSRRWLYVIAALTIVGGSRAPSLIAGQSPVGSTAHPSLNPSQSWTSPEQFRTEYLKFIDTLSARIPESDQSSWAVGLREKISDLREQVNGLSDATATKVSKLIDRRAFTRMADGVARGTDENKGGAGRFRTLGAIQGPDYAGAIAGTTCSITPTSAERIGKDKLGSYISAGIQVPLDYACATFAVILFEGSNLPFCIAAGVAKAGVVILESLIDHEEFCNGLLDGAKADAAFNDVVDIHGDVEALDTHLTNVDNHIEAEFGALDAHTVTLFNGSKTQVTNSTNLLSAGLKQVMKLELTPQGQRQIAPSILTCTVAANNCPNVLTKCTGAGGACSWNNVGPLP